MSDTKKVIIDVDVNTGEASVDLTRFQAQIDAMGKRIVDLKAKSDKTSKSMSSGFAAGADAAALIPGPIGMAATAMSGLTGSIGRVSLAFKTLKGALISTGIGALVVAVGTLIAYFTTTEAGAQKLRVAMATLGAAVSVVMNAMFGLLSGLKSIATGDFSGGIDKIGNSFSGLGSKIAEGTKQAYALEQAMNAVMQAEDELNVKRSESNLEIAKARLLADDLTLSTNERAEAIKKAAKLEEDVAAQEQAIAAERLRILEGQIKARGKADEAENDAVDEAKARLNDLERETIMRQKRLGTELQSLKNEEETKQKERHAAELAAVKERNDREVELAQQKAAELQAIADSDFKIAENRAANQAKIDEYIAEASAITAEERLELNVQQALKEEDLKFQAVTAAIVANQQNKDQLLADLAAAEQLHESERNNIENDLRHAFNEKKLEDEAKLAADLLKIKIDGDAKVLAADKAAKQARLQLAGSVASALGSIGQLITNAQGEQTVASKAFAVAQLAINTATSISAAIAGATDAAAALGPGAVVATPAFIATQVATVLAAVAQASAILSSVPGGGSPSIPTSAGISAPSIAPVTTNTTQLGNTQQAELQPVQAYVVETQITGSQTNINQIESQSTFGGG